MFSSCIIKLSLSSSWPLNFVPETKAPKSSEIILKSFNESGTFLSTISCASNFAIEVLPTPGIKLKKDGSRQTTEEKVFPGYVLVRMILDEDTMMAVKSTPNVINFVGAEDGRGSGRSRGHIKPRPLSRQEVNRIFKRASEKKAVIKLDIEEKDRIIVTSGPFKDFQGEVIEVSGERNKLKALLSIFGRETPVELEFSQINKQN